MNTVEMIGHSLGLGLLLWAVLKFLPTQNKAARWLAVGMVWLFTIKYFTWRLDSLPGVALALGSIWPLSFFALEVLTIAYELWGYLVMGRTTNRTPEADDGERRLRGYREQDLPTVDVFIATYNEPLDVLEKTIRAALALEYPRAKLTVHVGDDGNRQPVNELCNRLGATYHSRPKLPDGSGKVGGDGKAGNDRYTFSKSSGDFIIMLDADFVLVKNFVWRTLGLLLFYPDRALVQTPQRFYNVDVFGLNLKTKQVPDEQHFFMTITQACRDAWGNAFCVGSNCIVRRKDVELLDPQWGFPASTICEDLELSYALLGKGKRTVFLNEALAFGAAPEAVSEYLKQRVRWCTGTIQNMFAPTGPLRGRGLRLIDRVFYMEGLLFWLGYLFTAALIVAPLIYWSTGIPLMVGAPEAMAAALLPRLVVRMVVAHWISEGKLPWVVWNASKFLPAFHLAGAVIKGIYFHISLILPLTLRAEINEKCARATPVLKSLRNIVSTWCSRKLSKLTPEEISLFPERMEFKVTAKAKGNLEQYPYLPTFMPFLIVAVLASLLMSLNLLGLTNRVPMSEVTPLNVIWTTFSIIVCLLCVMTSIEQPSPGLPLIINPADEVATSSPIKLFASLARRSNTASADVFDSFLKMAKLNKGNDKPPD